ncbi:MAG: redoxin family protein [Saprospiraceae bacterium]|nr:redoxin family protein [Saprospiraceae bacterium]
MKSFFTLLLFFTLAPLTAQPAPDFTVTTSTGQSIQLYDDLLNQGKTVVLKLFFTTCPPCNEMAPLMEPFYQTWGGGNADVEFISLSIQSFDSNVKVNMYKQQYGHTFPGVGSQGGSLSAILPYTTGSYGEFLGTPTFVVIAPNGNVQFNPRGASHSATLDSVDVAILNTGAVKPPVSYSAAGTVVFGTAQAGVAGVIIGIDGISEALDTTDASGNFNFVVPLTPGTTYTLKANKDTNYANGISTLDVIKIRRHLLGVAPFTTPYELLAAEVSGEGQISNLDIVLMTQLILGLIAHPTESEPSWIFLNPDFAFPGIGQTLFLYNSGATNLRFTTTTTGPLILRGVKKGDVNESADGSQ